MQEKGEQAAIWGGAAAVIGAPTGIGAASGAALVTAGEFVSGASAILEIGIELVAGSNKNAKITFANEAVYKGIGLIG